MASSAGAGAGAGSGAAAASEGQLVQAVYSFKGKNNDELCLKKGDVITVSQRDDGGWWEGTLGETTGWFPSNYVREYREKEGAAASSPARAPREVQAFRNVVLDDIADSERAHVLELRNLVVHFLQPLEKADLLARDECRQLTANIGQVLRAHEDLSASIDACKDQRVGGLFLQRAPALEAVHKEYCAAHPRAVCILDKHKEELNAFMENCGAACPGLLVLTTGLSKPFRRLQKYPAMLQELGRHALESHPDRGDAHRAVAVYEDIASACAATRRQKELELQVVTGAVRGWQGAGGSKDLASLGEVLHMGGVALGDAHADRYFVLFPSALLILSVSRRMSAFVYEGCLPLAGITACKLEDTDNRKNAFEISGSLIDTIFAVCQSNAEAEKWVELLRKYSSSVPGDGVDSVFRRSPLKYRNPRDSLYHVTLPPSTYPSASPYAALSKYFAKLVRLRVITRKILKHLLYSSPGLPPDLSSVVYRKRQKNVVRDSEEEDSYEDESETESETTESDDNSRLRNDEDMSSSKIYRQNAIDCPSENSFLIDNPFEYVRYYDSTPSDKFNTARNARIDCTYEIFENLTIGDERAEETPQDNLKIPLCFLNQNSECSDNSSFDCNANKNYMACEDLVNVDQNLAISSSPFGGFVQSALTRHSCPTKFVANKFNDSTLTLVCTPGRDSYGSLTDRRKRDIFEDLEPKKDESSPILEPPVMFRNDSIVPTISTQMADLKNALNFEEVDTFESLRPEKKNCSMCNGSQCHTPRSSDSGVAGSCNLASPEIAVFTQGETRSLHDATYDVRSHLSNDYSMSTGEINRLDLESGRLGNSRPSARRDPPILCVVPAEDHERRRPFIAAFHGRSIPDLAKRCNFNEERHRPASKTRRARSKSEDLAKKLAMANGGRVTYRSELYAHWWMKAKLPVIVTSPGKDAFVTSPTEASLSSTAMPQGISNHKRSHSFNNHHSYAQYLQQQKQREHQQDKNGWIQSSCDALLSQTKSPALASRSASFAPRSTPDEARREGLYRESKRWSSKCLRPAPPLRPAAANRGGDDSALRRGKVNSYEEDALILRVIEAYCSSARSRNALNSAGSGRSSCSNALSRASSDSNCKGAFEGASQKRPETRKLLTERKARPNNCNLSRRSAPLLDAVPSRRASSPLPGGVRSERGAVLLPARAPSLPLASAWCCGSFAKQLRKTHHFD